MEYEQDLDFCEGCEFDVEDPVSRLNICAKGKHPTVCKMEAKEDYLIERAEMARQDR